MDKNQEHKKMLKATRLLVEKMRGDGVIPYSYVLQSGLSDRYNYLFNLMENIKFSYESKILRKASKNDKTIIAEFPFNGKYEQVSHWEYYQWFQEYYEKYRRKLAKKQGGRHE